MRHKRRLIRYKARVKRARRLRAYWKTVSIARSEIQARGVVRLPDTCNQYGEKLRACMVTLGEWTSHSIFSTIEIGEAGA